MSVAVAASTHTDAPEVTTLTVIVSAGVTPYVARTLRAVARQTVVPDVLLVVDVASRTNGLGDGTPVAEAIAAAGVDDVTAVRIVHVPEATGFGDAVSRGLEHYVSLVATGNRRRSTATGTRTLGTVASGSQRSASGQMTGPAGALSPITASEQRQLASASDEQQDPVGPGQVWLWLLHDDSAPEPGCLAELLAAVASARSVGVAGPKQVDWDEPSRLLEVGLRTTASARRANDIVDGEIDQGQHDDRSDVLAVGTAGALVDRAVWNQLGGTSPSFPVFGDGLELCRGARLAGYRVIVVPQAVVSHRRASYLGLRRSRVRGVERPGRRKGARSGRTSGSATPGGPAGASPELESPDPDRSFKARRIAQLTAWATFSTRSVPMLLAWFVLVGCVRAAWRLLTKELGLAGDELSAALTVLGRGGRIRAGRARLATHQEVRRSVLSRLYVEPSEIRAVRRDRVRQERERVARATAPSELEQQELAVLARRRRRVLAVTLVGVSAAALLGLSGVLVNRAVTGGALVGFSGSWRQIWDAAWTAWASSGDGYAAAPAPLLAVLAVPMAMAAQVGLGGDGLIHLIIVAALPLAALGAWFAAGTVTRRTALRSWAAVSWAFAPALLLGVGQGRLSAIMVHLVLPWALLALARAVGADRRDVVLSGLVGAHHATAEEKEELDRFASSRMSDLADLDAEYDAAEEPGETTGTNPDESDEPARGDAAQDADTGSSPQEAADAHEGDGATQAQETEEADEAPQGKPSGRRVAGSSDEAALAPGARAVALARIVEQNDAEFGPAPQRPSRRARHRRDDTEEDAVTAATEPGGDVQDTETQDADARDTDAQESPADDDAPGPSQKAAAAALAYGPGSPTAAAVAGLLLVVVVAASPITAALLVPGILILAVVARRSALRLVLTLLPVVATAWPVWAQAVDLAGAHGERAALRYLLTDFGAPVANASPSAIELLLGVPVDIESILTVPVLALVAKALLAIAPALAVLGLVTTGMRGHLARAGMVLALAGLVLAGVSTRVTTSMGTGPDATGSLTVTSWAGTGVSLALAGLLMAALVAGDAAYGVLARRPVGWRNVSLAVVSVLAMLVPVTVGAAWAVAAQGSSATGPDAVVMALRGASQQIPVIAGQMQSSSADSRVLVLTSTEEGLVVRIWREPGTHALDVRPDVLAAQLRDRTSAPPPADLGAAATGEGQPMAVELGDPADAELVDLVARATSGQDEDVADALAAHGIAVVLLTDLPGDDLTATARSGLGSTPGLEQLAQTAAGTSWRVAPSQAPEAAGVVLVDAQGTTVLPSESGSVRTQLPPAGSPRTVVLAERADPGWRATLDGQPLVATTAPGTIGQWRQAFIVPEQGGELVITHGSTASTWAVRAMWVSWAVAGLAALPLRRRRTVS